MYKIINVTDKEGNIKQEFINEIKSVHPNLSGELLLSESPIVGKCLYFVWNDNSGKILRTSTIESYNNNGDIIQVTTQNSIYYLEKENI